MRKLLLLAALVVSINSFGQKFEGLPIVDGKVTYDFTFKKDSSSNFKKISKMSLANYARYYNTLVTKLENKLTDYISYEDESEVDASLNFTADAGFSLNVFNATASIKKVPEGIRVIITDFQRSRNSNPLTGYNPATAKIENLKGNPDRPIFQALDKQVKVLLRNFYDLN